MIPGTMVFEASDAELAAAVNAIGHYGLKILHQFRGAVAQNCKHEK
jgi:hypothetical protein